VISRRRLLQFTAAAAGAGAALRWSPGSVLASEGALPPSLAALKSMKTLAKPITREERAARLDKARRLMAENRLDAMLLIGGTSLVYFTGIRWWLSERLFTLVLPARGQAFFVCPAFEADRSHEQIALGPLDKETPVLLWEEDESPYKLVAQGLKERGIASGRVGIEETVRFVYADGVAKAAPALELVSATPVTAGCRQVKSAHEIELMRLASKVTITAYEAAWRALKPGMTESDFETLVSTAHERLGFEGGAGVQTGIYSALPHGSLTPQVIRENTILLMDGGCRVEGYESDISRTFVLGKPSDKMKKVFEIVHKAQSAALGTARPGVEAQSVDAAARKVIEDAGYGPGYKYFSHRVGHGIGMDGHEWPYLVRGDAVALQPDMVFSDEPGIYTRGEFGVRLEDDLHITENGAELFTSQSPSLEHPFG